MPREVSLEGSKKETSLNPNLFTLVLNVLSYLIYARVRSTVRLQVGESRKGINRKLEPVEISFRCMWLSFK